jgi:hypothetical protein
MPKAEPFRFLLAHLAFRRALLGLVPLLLTGHASSLRSQTITIKLVNGRNGRPTTAAHVNVWVGNVQKTAIAIPTGKDGIARLRLTGRDDEVDNPSRCKDCAEHVAIDPIVKYDDTLRVNVPFVLCQSGGSNYSWLAIQKISTKQLINEGVVMPNTCGTATASSNPGELIIFVRALNFWEKMKE